MRIVRLFGLFGCLILTACAFAEVQVINGKKYECKDGLCYLVEESGEAVSRPLQNKEELSFDTSGQEPASPLPRIAQGYMRAEEFIAFLEGREVDSLAGHGLWVMLLLVLLGGLAMNLTPCVLPMMPINLMIIGRSAKRGLAYGLGIALAYGLLGVGAALGGLAFGDIQGSPWFNVAVAVVFVGLSLALFDVWFIDLARFRSGRMFSDRRSGDRFPVFAFGMGAMSAVLAGACVAPVLIAVLVFTADLVARGKMLALGLPFVMGIGMALPWPFAGAGMKVLPKPGAWMKWVNRVFGVIVLGFAAYYGWLAWRGWQSGEAVSRPLQDKDEFSITSGQETPRIAPPSELASLGGYASPFLNRLASSPRPVLVDCWATWCKNCAAMDKVMEKPEVREALKPFTVIRLQAEDISELRKVKGFESIRGLPAFVIFE